ncbi:PTS sugar transporter subunit IIC [Halobacillus sp. HZG1]|uniref:PTS transporter subunit IIC n=1 Tax=Halobacillus sp. HZG1 TaxID=3111769 RepID=UPI002DB9D4E8|nr:PTS sugar transporter subunit IIC [Halobacillus sp. HZG1]MEC3885038.1 PTS sugar transporter subunit IIC [Halobacillus sp. HZG1]
MLTFLKRKGVQLSFQAYFVTALSYMALGLFSSLIIGLIIKTIGEQTDIIVLSESFIEMGTFAMDSKIWGGAIGAAIAYGLKAPPLVIFAALFSGAAGAELGGPAGSYIAALLATEFGKIVSKETKIDIILTPFVTIIVGYCVAAAIGAPIGRFMAGIGSIINWATQQQPLVMGALVAVLMGIALTAPISSLAIALMLSLDGVAAGAATVGCAAQMIGFATISYRDNGFGGALAQGIGTSMLQVANVVKKPLIILPPTIAGAVLAPIATVWLSVENNAAGSGMGTSGFVGQIMTFESMGFSWDIFWIIVSFHFIGPALISYLVALWFRRKGWIKPGDMIIQYD